MLPIEVVLFLAHLCQLIFIGMPIGVEDSMWLRGLMLMAFASVAREVFAGGIARASGKMLPRMPWEKLPGSLIAFMMGVGVVLSAFVQVNSFWHLYAHHWAACFMGGSDSMGTARDTQVGDAVVMAVICIAVFGVDILSICSWAAWMAQLRLRQLGTMAALDQPEVVLKKQASSFKVDRDADQPVIAADASSGSILSRSLSRNVSGDLIANSPMAREPRTSSKGKAQLIAAQQMIAANLKPESHSPHSDTERSQRSQEILSRTWDVTLHSLWEDDKRDTDTPVTDPPLTGGTGIAKDIGPSKTSVPGLVEVETLVSPTTAPMGAVDDDDEWAGAQRLPSKDLHLKLSMNLLEQFQKASDIEELETQEAPQLDAQNREQSHQELLKQVLAELPADDQHPL
jgi:hypothetical protein